MNERHFDFWPKRTPRSLTLPETSVFHNLEVSARRSGGGPARGLGRAVLNMGVRDERR